VTKTTIDFEKDIKPLMDEKYSLIYVDRNDDLSNQLEAVQAAIHNPENNTLWETIEDCYQEHRWDSEEEAQNELRDAIMTKFNLEQEGADAIVSEHEDHIREIINDRDDSDTLKDLIRNTGDQVFFYSTGALIGDYSCPIKDRLREIKKALGIKQRDKSYDNSLEEMCYNAGYGGELVIYFTDSIGDWLDWNNENAGKKIVFSGFHVAIIDTSNGSGNDTFIGHTTSLPFNRESLFLCRVIKYSYTYDVCGMSSDWCKDTKVSLEATKSKKTLEKGNICKIQNQVLEYERVFKAGSCSAGDMNITRHRHTSYSNNFPCGTRCADCGTFWID